MKKIVMTFGKDGTTKIEAFGFSGAACLAATKDLEEALGAVEKRDKKPEMGTVISNEQLVGQGR